MFPWNTAWNYFPTIPFSRGEKQVYFCLSKDRRIIRAFVCPVKNMRAVQTRRETTRPRRLMEYDRVCIGWVSGCTYHFLRLMMAFAELYHVLGSLKSWDGEFSVEILQEQYRDKFYSSHSFWRHQEHEYASVIFSGFQIVTEGFVAAESGSEAVLSWSVPDGSVVLTDFGISPFSQPFTFNMLRDDY